MRLFQTCPAYSPPSGNGFRFQERFQAEPAVLASESRLLEPAGGSERLVRRAVDDDATAFQSIRKRLHACGVGAR